MDATETTDEQRREEVRAQLAEAAKGRAELEREAAQQRKILHEMEARRKERIKRMDKDVKTQIEACKLVEGRLEVASRADDRLRSEYVDRKLLARLATAEQNKNRAKRHAADMEQKKRQHEDSVKAAEQPLKGIRGGKTYTLRRGNKEKAEVMRRMLKEHEPFLVEAKRDEAKTQAIFDALNDQVNAAHRRARHV